MTDEEKILGPRVMAYRQRATVLHVPASSAKVRSRHVVQRNTQAPGRALEVDQFGEASAAGGRA